jgi:hypothetical protein
MPVRKLPMPDQDYLLSLFSYDPETGILSRKSSGFIVGNARMLPYPRIKIDGKTYVVHRIIWRMMTNGPMPDEVDHINNDRFDNRWCNLRAAERTDNMCNFRLKSNNKSGIKGVSWRKSNRKWAAQIQHNNKRLWLGIFDDPTQAQEVYLEAAKRLHGEFANDGFGPI